MPLLRSALKTSDKTLPWLTPSTSAVAVHRLCLQTSSAPQYTDWPGGKSAGLIDSQLEAAGLRQSND